jgi:hypothetical protein
MWAASLRTSALPVVASRCAGGIPGGGALRRVRRSAANEPASRIADSQAKLVI